jgi:hypothetical protein
MKHVSSKCTTARRSTEQIFNAHAAACCSVTRTLTTAQVRCGAAEFSSSTQRLVSNESLVRRCVQLLKPSA